MEPFKAKITKNYSLSPILSEETIKFHYEKHHCGYANTLNQLIANTAYVDYNLENIILRARIYDAKIFNAAAQLFNHNFYWKSLKTNTPLPTGNLRELIETQFGNMENFIAQYAIHANSLFGNGWSWLVEDYHHKLQFIQTTNAETLLGNPNLKLLCVIDLWEHAYYIDYRNDRSEYIKQVLEHGINWTFCEQRFDQDFDIIYNLL